VAAEAKATKRPSAVIEELELAPLAGVTPSGVEMRFVTPVQTEALKAQVREKISCSPLGFGAFVPRLFAEEVNDMLVAKFPTEGFALALLAGVVPSDVEIKNVVGTHVVLAGAPSQVSRTNT
jgi:hypothetical protein